MSSKAISSLQYTQEADAFIAELCSLHDIPDQSSNFLTGRTTSTIRRILEHVEEDEIVLQALAQAYMRFAQQPDEDGLQLARLRILRSNLVPLLRLLRERYKQFLKALPAKDLTQANEKASFASTVADRIDKALLQDELHDTAAMQSLFPQSPDRTVHDIRYSVKVILGQLKARGAQVDDAT